MLILQSCCLYINFFLSPRASQMMVEEDINDHTLVINYMAYSDIQFLLVVVVEN